MTTTDDTQRITEQDMCPACAGFGIVPNSERYEPATDSWTATECPECTPTTIGA